MDYLRSAGVSSFAGFGISVTFYPEEPEPQIVAEPRQEKKITSIWDNPTLWPGGEPPKFPGK